MTFTRAEIMFSRVLGFLDKATGFVKDGGPQTTARVFGQRKSVAENVSRYLDARSSGLDVGAGDGSLTRHFTAKGHILLSSDPYLPSGAEGVSARGETLPFSNSSFDFVTAVYALHHCEQPDLVLDEMIRVLTLGGILAVLEEHPRFKGQEIIMQANEYRANILLHGIERSSQYLLTRSNFYGQTELRDKLINRGMRQVEEIVYPSLSIIRQLYKSKKVLGIYQKTESM